MAADTEAIEALTAAGLTEYQARCFVALTQLSQGTAKEISRVADVPQSRVYDVTEQLHEKGLVDIEEADPQRYIALPVPEAMERLRREYDDYLATASDALETLQSRERDEDGAWTISSREGVLVRLRMHLDDATDEVYLHVAHGDLLDEDLLEAVVDAADRGCTIYFEVPTAELRATIHDRIPTAHVTVSDLQLDAVTDDDRDLGRVLMVDRETILLSARTEGLVPGESDETGLWGSEVGHGLVVWLQPLLTDRIENGDFRLEA